MTPANEAWIREIAATDAIGTAAKIARICLEEIDQLRALNQSPSIIPQGSVVITEERLEYLEMRDRRCWEWDAWAHSEIYDDGQRPLPEGPVPVIPPQTTLAAMRQLVAQKPQASRRRKAGQA